MIFPPKEGLAKPKREQPTEMRCGGDDNSEGTGGQQNSIEFEEARLAHVAGIAQVWVRSGRFFAETPE
jgi:hypothetical protein